MYCISSDGTQLEYGSVYDGEFYGTYFHTNGSRYSSDRFSKSKPPTGEPLNLKPKSEGGITSTANELRLINIMKLAELSKKHKSEAFFVELFADGLL